MYQINQNIIDNNYNNGIQKQNIRQVPFAQTVNTQPLPDYYTQNVKKKGFKETMEEDPFFSIPYQMMIKPLAEHPVSSFAAWLGFGALLDLYNESCGGEYKGSFLQKVASAGDKFQESKLVQNKPVQVVLDGLKSVKKGGGKVLQKSAILRAMKNTPSMPEWSMTKAQLFNQEQEVVQDFMKIVDALQLDGDGHFCDAFNDDRWLVTSKYEKDLVKNKFGVSKFSDVPKELRDSHILLKRLGKSDKEIDEILASKNVVQATKKEILKEMDLTPEKLRLIREDMFGKYIPDVKEATRKAAGRVKIGAGHYKFLGPLSRPFERVISCDEIYNKLHSMGDGAKTATGRFSSKFLQMIHRGLTFGGGKLGVLLFIAPSLDEVVRNTNKAGKDEKVGTLANGLVESVSWVFTFPLALKLMHNICGAQYAGMTKEQVQECRNIRDAVNYKNAQGCFASKLEHDAEITVAKNKIKELSTVKNQGFLTKCVRNLAKFVTMDLERFDGYNTGSFFSHQFYKLKNLPRNLVGIPMRFVLWGVLSMAVLGSLLTKGTAAIFGKSYDGMKQEEIKDSKKEQKKFTQADLNERLVKIQENNKRKKSVQKHSKQNDISHRGKNSLSFSAEPVQMNVIQEKQKRDNYTYIPSQDNIIQPPKKEKIDNYKYIPSQNCTLKLNNKNNPNRRSYIPSQDAANIIKTYDNSGMDEVFRRADIAESKALKILAGNFDDMA